MNAASGCVYICTPCEHGGGVRVRVCELRHRICSQENTHHTQSPPRLIAHAQWRGIGYKIEKLFDYKIVLAVYSSAPPASPSALVPAGRAQ